MMKPWMCRVGIVMCVGMALGACQREQPVEETRQEKGGETVTVSPTPAPTATEIARRNATTQTQFRIALVSGLGSLPGYAARQRDWFGEQGFQVTFTEALPDSTACLELLETGGVDVAYGVSLKSVLEADRKNPGAYRIVGFAAETVTHPVGAFLIPTDSDVGRLADLKDRKVAAAGGDFASRMAALAITGGKDEANARDIPSIEVSPVTPFDFAAPDSPEALFAAGEVMAGLTKGLPEERRLRVLETAPLAKVFFSPFPVQAVVMRGSLFAEDPKGVTEFAEANRALLSWCNEWFAETLPILQGELKLDDESTLNLFAPLFLSPGELTYQRLARAAELWTEEPMPAEQRNRLPKLVFPSEK